MRICLLKLLRASNALSRSLTSNCARMSSLAKIPTVSNFLFCFDLTTGGYVLAGIDAVGNGLLLLVLIINMLSGMSIISSETLNQFKILHIVIDEVVQVVLLAFFLLMALAFISGIKDVSWRENSSRVE